MRKKSQTILITLLCIACFGAGISVPAILNKKRQEIVKNKKNLIPFIQF